MNVKHTLLVTAIAIAGGALLLAPAANAADNGTITINGKVLSSTCSVNGNGSGNSSFTVTLPDVQSSALGTAGAIAGATAFAMSLTGCPVIAAPNAVQVGAQFYSTANTDTTTGTLKNTGVSNVDVQLMATNTAGATSGGTAVTIATAAPTLGNNANVTDQVAVSGTGTATLNYYAQYYAVATTAAGAGAVSTTVNYLINYQ